MDANYVSLRNIQLKICAVIVSHCLYGLLLWYVTIPYFFFIKIVTFLLTFIL